MKSAAQGMKHVMTTIRGIAVVAVPVGFANSREVVVSRWLYGAGSTAQPCTRRPFPPCDFTSPAMHGP
eukprot:4977504-Pleurochrysis_carterae.AAC.3